MKFWIRINGLQEGPMEISEMKDRNITPTTYVWCAGMKDWAYARDVEDLKDVITSEPVMFVVTGEKDTGSESASVEVDLDSEVDTPKILESKDGESADESEEEGEVCEEEESDDDSVAESEHDAELVSPTMMPEPLTPVAKEEPCPPTNLVWAILSTILCCMPLGIAAIVFAAQVNTKYYTYGYEEAKKYSDRAAWCVIWSIVLSILFSPVQMLLSLLSM